jgi:transposase
VNRVNDNFGRKTESEYVKEIEMLKAQIDTFTGIIRTLQNTIEGLRFDNQKLVEKIDVLSEMINKNSRNSSKPPSSDGYAKPEPKSLREKSGKKAGAQEGHKGNGLQITSEPDEVIHHGPDQCTGCPHALECKGQVADTRYEIDIHVNTKTIAHKVLVYQCPCQGGASIRGSFPEGINSTIQYGTNLAALAVALNTNGMVSINRTHEILSRVFGVPISTGTISAMVSRCANIVIDTVSMIREKVSSLKVAHFDETGIRVDGKLHWVHSVSDSAFTYLSVENKRGKEGMESAGVLPNFIGTAIHDCWLPYFKFKNMAHGICNAHIMRELTGAYENTGQEWSKYLIDLLLEMKRMKEKLLDTGVKQFSKERLEEFSNKYDLLMEAGIALNPVHEKIPGKRGRVKRGKTRALIDRLVQYKGEVCLFAANFSIPFDNNQAERDLRMLKVKQKVSGCFRTRQGANEFAAIMSYASTCHKHGISAFKAIKNAFLGDAIITAFS